MKDTDEVAIFWDYENCPAPSNSSGYPIVDNIRSVAQNFGSVTLFKAYLEVTEQFPTSRAQALRSELQSSGVSLIDCPHNGRKDVADKMILVDMLAHAIDKPAPSTILLISGDRDFAYALSILRLRRYHIVLITTSNAHPSLKAQASLSFNWTSDVLESADSTLSHQPTSPRRGKSAPAYDKFYSNPKDSRFPPQESYDEKPTSSADFANYFQDKIKLGPSSPTPRSPSKRNTRHDFLPPDFEQSKRQPAVASVTLGTPFNIPEPSARVIYSPAASNSSLPYLNGSAKISLTNSSQTTLTPNTPSRSTPKPATSGGVIASTHSTQRDSASLPPLEHHGIPRVTGPVSLRTSAAQIVPPEPCLRESLPSLQQGTYSSISTKDQSPSSIDRTNLPPTHPYIPPLPHVTATTLLSGTVHITPSTLLPPSAPSFITPSPLQPTASASPPKPTNPPPQHLLFPPVPEEFKILIRCLQLHRARGELRPLRTHVALAIARNGTTYQQAGVLRFGDYVWLAKQAGIVVLGGSGGNVWIALKQLWWNVPLS